MKCSFSSIVSLRTPVIMQISFNWRSCACHNTAGVWRLDSINSINWSTVMIHHSFRTIQLYSNSELNCSLTIEISARLAIKSVHAENPKAFTKRSWYFSCHRFFFFFASTINLPSTMRFRCVSGSRVMFAWTIIIGDRFGRGISTERHIRGHKTSAADAPGRKACRSAGIQSWTHSICVVFLFVSFIIQRSLEIINWEY